jgi:hypothetical protein
MQRQVKVPTNLVVQNARQSKDNPETLQTSPYFLSTKNNCE